MPSLSRSPGGRRTSSSRSSRVDHSINVGQVTTTSGGSVLLVVPAVDAESGAVVLEHCSNGRRVVDRSRVLDERLLTHQLAGALGAIPGVGVGIDRLLRLVGLGEEEPVPPGCGEAIVAALEMLNDRKAVQNGEPGHFARDESSASRKSDAAAAVVTGNGIGRVTEQPHQGAMSVAMARFEYGAWSLVVAGLEDTP